MQQPMWIKQSIPSQRRVVWNRNTYMSHAYQYFFKTGISILILIFMKLYVIDVTHILQRIGWITSASSNFVYCDRRSIVEQARWRAVSPSRWNYKECKCSYLYSYCMYSTNHYLKGRIWNMQKRRRGEILKTNIVMF
jgi:hypothetical protein